jgi:chemotaxis protein histidine kinase CheA
LTEQLPDIDPDILARAEAALTALSSQYPVWRENDLAAMRTLLQVARHRPDDRQDLWRELAAIAHNVKGLAGTFGFPRISELAADLHERTAAIPPAAPADPETVAAMIDGITRILKGRPG